MDYVRQLCAELDNEAEVQLKSETYPNLQK
jgi:hypothetical protein